jgi:hypothetical protein
MRAIRDQSRAGFDRITEAIAGPGSGRGLVQGILGGVFDAEGCYSGGILRIANCDAEIIDWVGSFVVWGSTTPLSELARRTD